MIAVEELEEARLGAGRSLRSAGPEELATVDDLLEIDEQIVDPQADPLADRRRLRRLRWVSPRQTMSFVSAALAASASITPASRAAIRSSESRISIKSVLSVTKALVAPRWRIGRASGAASP